jgi:hypothetical protein
MKANTISSVRTIGTRNAAVFLVLGVFVAVGRTLEVVR